MTANSLEALVAGVEQAVAEAQRQVVAAEATAAHWQQQYERERKLRDKLQQEQEEQQQAAMPPPPPPPVKVWATSLPTAPGSPPRPPTMRRHTAPALLPMPDMLDHLNSTASRLEELRRELERDLEAGRAADGSLAMSRLSSMLHACSFLREASSATCGGGGGNGGGCDGSPSKGAHSAAQLGDACSGSGGEGEEGQEVALHDDGAAGVGATAATAVSVALAQSWAAAAGARQASFRAAAAAEGAVRPGKARFKLVAAVPRSYRQQRDRTPTASASASRLGSSNGRDGGGAVPESPSAAALTQLLLGQSPSSSSILHKGPSFESTSGLVALAEAEPNTMDDAQEASWCASGQHLKLQWLSAPSTALVVYKPVPPVFDACVAAIVWLAVRGLTIFVEPRVHAKLVQAVQRYLDTGSGIDGQTTAGAAKAAVDLSRQLLTWEEGPCSCPPVVPCSVAHQLDVAIALGGDGTVLWTCGLFAAGAVPPLVPFAMGSLGFMTPFQIGCMGEVLSRVMGLDRGVPLMLRHRLQCRIIRSAEGNSNSFSADLAAACQEEFVVLNEVVIDRGMKAQLCNLQCSADQNHVTLVQGDGLIVATPTGSTAYNLAAGGAMVHPAVPCFLFTPICPHSLASRPLVLPEHVTLHVKVPLDSRSSAFCSFDGRARQELQPGDSVLIGMSQWPVPMVCNLDASHDWFLSMREGLSWNVRKQQAGRGQ